MTHALAQPALPQRPFPYATLSAAIAAVAAIFWIATASVQSHARPDTAAAASATLGSSKHAPVAGSIAPFRYFPDDYKLQATRIEEQPPTF